jgi:hypothetical protein
MFEISQDSKLLSFREIKDSTQFGDDDRVLFWIDLEVGMLQRGRQEMIPLSTVDSFIVKEGKLIANLGHHEMPLYEPANDEIAELEIAATRLNKAISR